MVWDLGQDPDREQVGRLDLPEEHLPGEEEEDHHRQEKGEGLGVLGWLRERLGRLGVPELNGSMTPVP